MDTLKLDVRTLSKRQLKIRLNEFRAQSHTTTLNDSIFAHILLGGNFGLLDFRLPRALARLFPQASRSLRPLHNRENLAVVTEKNIQLTVIARHFGRKRSFFLF